MYLEIYIRTNVCIPLRKGIKHLIKGGNPLLNLYFYHEDFCIGDANMGLMGVSNIWKQETNICKGYRKLYMETETGLQTPCKHLNKPLINICEPLKFAMIILKELCICKAISKRNLHFFFGWGWLNKKRATPK